MVFQCFKAIIQLLDSDWPANILAGSHFRAQETQALSPDGVCALARAWLATRLSLTWPDRFFFHLVGEKRVWFGSNTRTCSQNPGCGRD